MDQALALGLLSHLRRFCQLNLLLALDRRPLSKHTSPVTISAATVCCAIALSLTSLRTIRLGLCRCLGLCWRSCCGTRLHRIRYFEANLIIHHPMLIICLVTHGFHGGTLKPLIR